MYLCLIKLRQFSTSVLWRHCPHWEGTMENNALVPKLSRVNPSQVVIEEKPHELCSEWINQSETYVVLICWCVFKCSFFWSVWVYFVQYYKNHSADKLDSCRGETLQLHVLFCCEDLLFLMNSATPTCPPLARAFILTMGCFDRSSTLHTEQVLLDTRASTQKSNPRTIIFHFHHQSLDRSQPELLSSWRDQWRLCVFSTALLCTRTNLLAPPCPPNAWDKNDLWGRSVNASLSTKPQLYYVSLLVDSLNRSPASLAHKQSWGDSNFNPFSFPFDLAIDH